MAGLLTPWSEIDALKESELTNFSRAAKGDRAQDLMPEIVKSWSWRISMFDKLSLSKLRDKLKFVGHLFQNASAAAD